MEKTGLLLLLLMVPLLCGFAAPPPNVKHTIPQGMVGVRFAGKKEAQVIDLSYAEAKKIKDKIEQEDQLKWFFDEFDRDQLVFFSARYEPNPEKNRRPWGTYVIEKLYRVKRSQEAAEGLGVSSVIDLYETGRHGIKAGMTEAEVVKILGQPKSVNELGPLGSFDYIYDDVRVRFLDHRVAWID